MDFVFIMERAIKQRLFLMTFLTISSSSSKLERCFFLLVLLSLSEAENFVPTMLSVVSARSQCSTKVARSPFSGLKP